MTLAVDPTNPNIAYVGGSFDGSPSGYIRVDITALYDPHAHVAYASDRPDGNGELFTQTEGRISVRDNTVDAPTFGDPASQYLNLIRNPDAPFISACDFASGQHLEVHQRWHRRSGFPSTSAAAYA